MAVKKLIQDTRFYNYVNGRDGFLNEIMEFMVNIGADVIGPFFSEAFLGNVLTIGKTA